MIGATDDAEMLRQIVFYCESIEEVFDECGTDRENFIDKKRRFDFDVCVFYIGLIGEHVNKLTKEFRAAHSEVPWRQIIGLRNRIFHDYISVRKDQLFEVMLDEIPKLHEQCRSMLRALEPEANDYDRGDNDES